MNLEEEALAKNECEWKTWKGGKKKLNRGERSNTYLTHVFRLQWSIDSLGKIVKNIQIGGFQSEVPMFFIS